MTEQELARGAAHRLAIIRHAQEVTGNVSLACRYFGITRQAYYRWLRRYEEFGLEGLRDRSRRPHVSPNATKAEVVGKIVYLRRSYHFGPHKISMYLRRYHDVQISPSGVWRILKRLDMSRLPASQRYKRHVDRWKRYEKPLPGHRVQMDIKFIAPLPGSRKKHYQFTAIDDCTRIRVLRIYDRLNQQSAIRFLDYVLEKLPFKVEVLQTDNSAEFQAQFHYHVLDRGIGHVYIKPATPRLNGKVERFHRIDAEESYRMLEGVVISTTPSSSTAACRSGKTSTTSTAPTGGSEVRRRMRSSGRRRGPGRERTASAAHPSSPCSRTCSRRLRLLFPPEEIGDPQGSSGPPDRPFGPVWAEPSLGSLPRMRRGWSRSNGTVSGEAGRRRPHLDLDGFDDGG